MIRFGASMLGYIIVLFGAISVMNTLEEDNPLRYVLALLPIIPLIFAFLSYMWFVRRVDEMQRRIQFEAVAISMGSTIFITLTLGFLEVAGFPAVGMIWVPPIIILTWGLGTAIASRRYK